jgi:pimeloyl-ACP methyl ester carboxylesterase
MDRHRLQVADRRFARLLATILALIAIGLFTGCRTTVPRTPEGVVKSELKVKLTGKEVAVDFYLPQGLKQAPVVVVAHGFSRSRINMAGWGGLLASNGFIVAIPDLPAWSDHERNSQAIRELLDRILSKSLVTEPAPNGDAALMGFSMGGLCTLLAAATNDQVQCWVGLDPVDSGRKGAEAAKGLHIPCAVVQAEPSRCNADGNAKQMVAGLAGPLFALRVRDATHTDPEQPTDWLAELVCGKADPDRRAIFERYTLAVLKSVFFGDAPALAIAVCLTQLMPSKAVGWIYQGSALVELSRHDDGYAVLLQAHERFPHDEILAYDLACVCCALGRDDEAAGWICKAIALAGDEMRQRALEDPDLTRIRDRLKTAD